MEKTNISKRVVAGTLALLTVFGSAPATLQGVFAPTALVAQAVDVAAVTNKIEYSRVKSYIESVKVGHITYTSDMVAENTSFSAAADKIVTVTSTVPLALYKGDASYTKKNAATNPKYTSIINNNGNYALDNNTVYELPATLTAEEKANLAGTQTTDLSGYNSSDNIYQIWQGQSNLLATTKYKATSTNADAPQDAVYTYFPFGIYIGTGSADTTEEYNSPAACFGISNCMTVEAYNAAAVNNFKHDFFSDDASVAEKYDVAAGGTELVAAAANATTADLDGTNYIVSTSGGKFVYTYKATGDGVTADFVKKSITEVKTATGGAGTFAYTDANTNDVLANDALVYGTTVKVSCDKPFDITATGVTTVSSVWDNTTGTFVATFDVADKNDYKATTRELVKSFTYTTSNNTVLATSKGTPKDVVNGLAAKVSASYHESITGKQYKALTADEKKLYVTTPGGATAVADTVADTTLVYKKAATAIDNNGTIPFGTAGVSATITVNEDFLGKSAANSNNQSAIYTVEIKTPDSENVKKVIYGRSSTGDGVEIQDDLDVAAKATGFTYNNITTAGTYEATITVWPTTTTEAAKTATYKFTIGASDEISEEDITLELAEDSAGDNKSYLIADKTKTASACKKGETVEFATFKTDGVAQPVHVVPSLDAKFGLSEANGDYYFTGADTATVAGTVNTLTLNIVSGNYGGSVANPVQIPVKWTLVDPEAADDFTFTGKDINFNNVAADKTVTPRDIAEIDAEVKAQITNVSGKVKASEITFSYEPVDANGEDDLDREDQGGEGLPKSTGFWKITASWKGEVVKDAVFNYEDNKEATVNVTAVPANEDELSVVFGDTLDISAWKFYVGYVDAEHPGTEVNVDFMEDTELTFKMTPAVAVNNPTTGELIGYNHANWDTVANAYAADQLDLGNVGKKYIQLQATTNRVDAQHTGKNELDSGLYVVTASEFMINVVPKDLSKAVLADIIVSKGAATVVKIRNYLVDCDSATEGNQAYKATDKTTGAEFALEVVSGVTIASKVGDYDVEFRAVSDNYTGTIKTKWHVVENAAGYTLDITHADASTTAKAELSGLNKVKVEATRTTAGTLTSSTEFGVLYGVADDAAAAKEALVYEGAGTTCEIVAGDGIAKTVVDDKNAKGKFELTVTDPDNTWVVAYAKDEGGTFVYSAPYKVDINTLYTAKLGANLKMDAPVYIDDNGTIKAYAYVERPEIKVGDAGKETEITPVEWGVVVSRDGKYAKNSDKFVLGAADTVKGTSKGATGAYTAYNYGVKVKVTNQYADMYFKPYCKFADGSVFYGNTEELQNLNKAVTDAVNLATTTVDNNEKAKMRVTRKVTGAYIAAAVNTNAVSDVEKLTYTKKTQDAVAANPATNTEAKAAVTTTLKLVDLSNASGFGIVVDKSGASATVNDPETLDVDELEVTKNTLVVGNKTYTAGASKTPNVSSITETIGGKDYVIGALTEGKAAYGAATVPTNTETKTVTFRGYVTFGTYTFYTEPAKCTLKAPTQGTGTDTGAGTGTGSGTSTGS
jgi:hypothetical protein